MSTVKLSNLMRTRKFQQNEIEFLIIFDFISNFYDSVRPSYLPNKALDSIDSK